MQNYRAEHLVGIQNVCRESQSFPVLNRPASGTSAGNWKKPTFLGEAFSSSLSESSVLSLSERPAAFAAAGALGVALAGLGEGWMGLAAVAGSFLGGASVSLSDESVLSLSSTFLAGSEAFGLSLHRGVGVALALATVATVTGFAGLTGAAFVFWKT